jgi:dihydroxy-acid dehydratase
MAIGCSTNSVLHLFALAHELGLDLELSLVNEISEKNPIFADWLLRAAIICRI